MINCGNTFDHPNDGTTSCSCLCDILDLLGVGDSSGAIFEEVFTGCAVSGTPTDFTYDGKNFVVTFLYTSPANPSGNNVEYNLYEITRVEDSTTTTSTTSTTTSTTTLSGTTTTPSPTTTDSPTPTTTTECCFPPPNTTNSNIPQFPVFTTRSIPRLIINPIPPTSLNPLTVSIQTTIPIILTTTTTTSIPSTTQQIKIECDTYCKKLGF